MKKNILFVIDSLNSGGAEKSLVNLLNSLPENKYNIDLYLTSLSGLYLPLIPKIIVVKKINRSKKLIYVKLIDIIFSFFIRINKILSLIYKVKLHGAQLSWYFKSQSYASLDKEYDVAIAYSQGFPTYFIVNYTKANKKLAWINTDYKKAGYNPKFDKEYYDKFDIINLVTPEAAKIFGDLHPNCVTKLSFIPDIISSELILRLSAEQSTVSIDESKCIILTIGRLVDVKGYDLAIDAARVLKDKGFSFLWLIIGEGPLELVLKNKIKDLSLTEYFQFLGIFLNPYPIMAKCNIYCQPSRYEGYGMAIAEAKILNKPIVATNFNVVYNQIIDQYSGLIVEMNGESIAYGIERLMIDSILKKSIVENISNSEKGNEKELNKIKDLIDIS